MPMVMFGVLKNLEEEDIKGLAQILGVSLEALADLKASDQPLPEPLPGPQPGPPILDRPHLDAAPEIVQTVIREEWPHQTWERAAMIAKCESTFDERAHNTNGEDSRGLWQINVVPGANIDLLGLGDLFDPRINARAGAMVWARQGWRAWWNCAGVLGIPRSGPGVP